MKEDEHDTPDSTSPRYNGVQTEPRYDDEALMRDVEVIEQHLHFIRRAMRRSIDADTLKVSLTAPQMSALKVLTTSVSEQGLTLKELSKRMELAHSTVSGIVDRLERQGLVRRFTDPTDRRSTRVDVTDAVKGYVRQSLPMQRLGPLMDALQQASEEERRVILEGLTTLHHLFLATEGHESL